MNDSIESKREFKYGFLLLLILSGFLLNGCSSMFGSRYQSGTTENGNHYAGMTKETSYSDGYYVYYTTHFHGEGILTLKNGDRYIGEFDLGKRHGYGIMILKGQGAFAGKWENGEPSGPMKYYKNGALVSIYEYREGKFIKTSSSPGSIFENSHKKAGTYDRVVYDDGGRYEGGLLNGKRDGFGVYTWPNGDVYYGEWKNGQMHGIGSIIYSNKSQWTGKWEYGKKVK